MRIETDRPGARHDHDQCIADALAQADAVCAAAGARLTATRRRVLELVWQSHVPVKAYGLLESMQRDKGGMVNPPTVYRALDFLLNMKLIHRIQALNAYVGCADPVRGHCGCLMICEQCHSVADVPATELEALISRSAAALGFQVSSQNTEIFGRCSACGGLPDVED